jgi:RNA polymerase sigma-70 factor (sigma-E family)
VAINVDAITFGAGVPDRFTMIPNQPFAAASRCEGREVPVERYEGFAEFVVACGPSLSRTAFLLTGDHHNAEDLLQTALVRTAPHWRRVANWGNPEAYVRRVMINERTSWWRLRRPITAPIPDQPAGTDESDQAASRLTMALALAALPPRQRAVIILRYYHDYPIDEVADVLGCSPGTVKSQAHHALQRLRQLLPELADERRNAPDVP